MFVRSRQGIFLLSPSLMCRAEQQNINQDAADGGYEDDGSGMILHPYNHIRDARNRETTALPLEYLNVTGDPNAYSRLKMDVGTQDIDNPFRPDPSYTEVDESSLSFYFYLAGLLLSWSYLLLCGNLVQSKLD